MPEGTDPAQGLVYLTSAGTTLIGVDPLTGQVKTSVSGSGANGTAEMYVVRDGVALGLGGGANGDAWAYDVAAGRVTWTSSSLPWPHYFSDLSGLGGSAAVSGDSDVVVIAACPQLSSRPRPPPRRPLRAPTPSWSHSRFSRLARRIKAPPPGRRGI